jgi:hypothetical protein
MARFNADRSDVFQEAAVKVYLRHWFERCSAPFTFDRVIVDRDNNSTPGKNVENENLVSALTNSLSFANSEFTFSSNLPLNTTIEVKAVQRADGRL